MNPQKVLGSHVGENLYVVKKIYGVMLVSRNDVASRN